MKLHWSVVLVFCCLACGGATELRPGADRIEWYSQRPDGDFQMVGDVQCELGGNFVSPGSNARRCRNEIRNQALELGADFVVVPTETVGSGECTNCVVFVGTAYRSRSGGGSAPAAPAVEAAPPPAVEAAPPPATSGGDSSFESELRGGLDQRRDVILECTGGAATNVILAYDTDGTMSFSLAGVHSGTEAEACVRAAFGQARADTRGSSGVVTHRIEGTVQAQPSPPPEVN